MPERVRPLLWAKPQRPGPSTIALVNLENGEIVHEGSLLPHVERRHLSNRQLAGLWDSMLTLNQQRWNRVLWDMAAGHDEVVKFLRSKLLVVPQPLSREEIAMWVEALRSD